MTGLVRPWGGRFDYLAEQGATLDDIVADTGVTGEVRLLLDGQPIPRGGWGMIRPAPGAEVVLRPVPTGGGDKDVGRTIATVAVIAAAAYTGGAAAGALSSAGFSGAVASAGQAVAGAAVGYAGMMAVNQLFPPPDPDTDDDRPRDQVGISGTRNKPRPYEPIRRIFGRHKVFPDLAAKPFTELVGQDQYLRMLLCLGYGPLDESSIADTLQIGETGLDLQAVSGGNGHRYESGTYQDTLVEIADLSQGHDEPTLYTNTVTQEQLSVRLEQDGDGEGEWHQRTTEPDTDEIGLTFTYPGGLKEVQSDNDERRLRVECFLQYREAGSDTWQDVPADAEVTGPGSRMADDGILITSRKKFGLFRVGVRFETGARGQYEVRIKRYRTWNLEGGWGAASDTEIPGWRQADARDADDDGETDTWYYYKTRGEEPGKSGVAKLDWNSLKSISHTSPIGDSPADECVYIALRIRATDQLNGTIDRLSCVPEALLPVYDGSAWTSPQKTRNAAWAFAAVHRSNAFGVDDSKLDADALKAWADHLDSLGITFDAVIEEQQPVQEMAQKIASAGRAQVTRTDDFRVSVAVDKERSTPVQVFSPRNILKGSFSSSRTYADELHGVKVQWTNPDTGWQRDERAVYADGYDSSTATNMETIKLFGCADPDQPWKHGRYWLAVQKLRPETYTFDADFEHLVCQRGDLVRVQHDVPMWGQISGRIKAVTTNDDGNVTAVELDEQVSMESGTDYGATIRLDDLSAVHADAVNDPGDHTSLTFVDPVTGPQAGDLLLFGERGSESVDLVVKDIEHAGDLTATITALDHSPEIFEADTGDIPEFGSQITVPDDFAVRPPPKPEITDVVSDEGALREAQDGSLEERIRVSVEVDDSGDRPEPAAYHLEWRRVDTVDDYDEPDAWERLTVGDPQRLYCEPVEALVRYDVRVRTVSQYGYVSDWATVHDHEVTGKKNPPPDVTGFRLSQNGPSVNFRWDEIQVRDLAGYHIRYGTRGKVTAWEQAADLKRAEAGDQLTSAAVPAGDWTFFIKARDRSGNWSTNANVKNFRVHSEFDPIVQDREDPHWLGIREGCIRHWTGVLVPKSRRMAADYTADELFDEAVPDPVPEARYTVAWQDIDFDDENLGIRAEIGQGVPPTGSDGMSVRHRVEYIAEDESAELEYDTELDGGDAAAVDAWDYDTELDGGDAAAVAAGDYDTELDGGLSVQPEAWADGTTGGDAVRYVRHQVVMDTSDGVGYVSSLQATCELEIHTASADDLEVADDGTRFTFSRRFHRKPRVFVGLEGSDVLIPTKEDTDTEGTTIHVYQPDGTEVGTPSGITASYEAVGV
ncbi:MAG: host specificity factor TipJ family phage tail protein [Thiohalospira sp.]